MSMYNMTIMIFRGFIHVKFPKSEFLTSFLRFKNENVNESLLKKELTWKDYRVLGKLLVVKRFYSDVVQSCVDDREKAKIRIDLVNASEYNETVLAGKKKGSFESIQIFSLLQPFFLILRVLKTILFTYLYTMHQKTDFLYFFKNVLFFYCYLLHLFLFVYKHFNNKSVIQTKNYINT